MGQEAPARLRLVWEAAARTQVRAGGWEEECAMVQVLRSGVWLAEVRNPALLLLRLAGKTGLALSDLQALQVLLGQVIAEPVLVLEQRGSRGLSKVTLPG